MTVFSDRLQQAMLEKQLNQSELAKQIKVRSQTVNGWCHGRIFPRWDILEQLPEITGKPLYWFFMTENEEQNPLPSGTPAGSRQARILSVIRLLPRLSDDMLQHLLQEAAEWLEKHKP